MHGGKELRLSRRSLGRLALASGAGLALGGCGTAAASERVAAARAWRTTGTAVAAMKSFDDTLKSFMQARNIQAGSLAVTYKGRLVHARGFTWSADSALTTQPTSLFRLASVSKPITGAAILRLVQDGKLSLSTPVTSLLTLTPPPGRTADPRLAQVTVRRLLQHLGGWDQSVSKYDPMFADAAIARELGVPLPVTPAQIVTRTSGLPLDVAPGTRYAYSNYGYLLLGRIIEKVSGQNYATYVQQKVLAPLKVTRMRLGRSLPANRAPGEVPYVSQYRRPTVHNGSGQLVPAPDGAFNLENMAANGGWLGTAVDLVRFATIFDVPVKATVLNSASISTAFAKPETGVNANGWYYGAGWLVRPTSGGSGRNTWHNGSLDGTSTLLVRAYNGMNWAVLFDQRDDPSGLSYGDIDAALWTAAGKVTSWPTGDQFPKYFA